MVAGDFGYRSKRFWILNSNLKKKFLSTGRDESVARQLTCDPAVTNCGRYNPAVDPSNTNDFTHGAFRWLHAFIPSTINLYSNGNPKTLVMSRALSDMNSTQVNILNSNYDNLLRGILFDPVNYGGYSPELRNRLMKDARGMGVDLFSIDIKRARDHGVPPYHAYIGMCTNQPVQINTWADMDPYFTPASSQILQKIYKSPRDIDLLVGVLGERRLTAYSILGKIGSCIIAEQFKRFKFGDRYFYQWTDGPYPFTRGNCFVKCEWISLSDAIFHLQLNCKRSNGFQWLHSSVQSLTLDRFRKMPS